jgi:hypothetical protein
MSIPEAQKKFGMEMDSTFGKLPDDAEILAWAKDKLG